MSKFVEADERHMALPAASTHAATTGLRRTRDSPCMSLGRLLVRVWPAGSGVRPGSIPGR